MRRREVWMIRPPVDHTARPSQPRPGNEPILFSVNPACKLAARPAGGSTRWPKSAQRSAAAIAARAWLISRHHGQHPSLKALPSPDLVPAGLQGSHTLLFKTNQQKLAGT